MIGKEARKRLDQRRAPSRHGRSVSASRPSAGSPSPSGLSAAGVRAAAVVADRRNGSAPADQGEGVAADPVDCGSTTHRTAVAVTAASIALPPGQAWPARQRWRGDATMLRRKSRPETGDRPGRKKSLIVPGIPKPSARPRAACSPGAAGRRSSSIAQATRTCGHASIVDTNRELCVENARSRPDPRLPSPDPPDGLGDCPSNGPIEQGHYEQIR